MATDFAISHVSIACYKVPTDKPSESDGTFTWDSTTMVLVEMTCGDVTGIGWTYGHAATAAVVRELAEQCITSRCALDIPALHAAMLWQVRNSGSSGVCAMAISAIDIALWDLKSRLLGLPLLALFGSARSSTMVYGSGGFTSYSDSELSSQLATWVAQGITAVKMKVGSELAVEKRRLAVARTAIGSETALMMDANGACTAREALALAELAKADGVVWFEEPVSSDHVEELAFLRGRLPLEMEQAAGEYVYNVFGARHLLQASAVDVLQLDATRCCGFTGFLACASLAASFGIPLSAHCSPSLHMHVAGSLPGFRHIEFFHDHARIERMFLDGFIEPRDGRLIPDLSRPGMGFEIRRADAERYRVAQ